MKQRIITLFLILISIIPAYSQWAIKGGINGDWFKINYGADGGAYNPRLGFHVGATYDLLLSNKLYLQPGLLFTTAGSNIESDADPSPEGKGFLEIYGIEAPLKLSFRPPIGKQSYFVLDVGLYGKCGLFGTYHMGSDSESPFNYYNRFDAGFNIGAGFMFGRIYTGLMYQQGFIDANKTGTPPYTSFRLSAAYSF